MAKSWPFGDEKMTKPGQQCLCSVGKNCFCRSYPRALTISWTLDPHLRDTALCFELFGHHWSFFIDASNSNRFNTWLFGSYYCMSWGHVTSQCLDSQLPEVGKVTCCFRDHWVGSNSVCTETYRIALWGITCDFAIPGMTEHYVSGNRGVLDWKRKVTCYIWTANVVPLSLGQGPSVLQFLG